MRKSHKYLVTYKIPGLHRKPREFVGIYLGENMTLKTLTFSMRPTAGTQEINPEHIIAFEETSATTPCGLRPLAAPLCRPFGR